MTGPRRYHPFFALGFMRRTLLLYLVPLVQVLFARDWPALRTALTQDLALFCVLALVSLVALRVSSWELDAGGALRLRWDLFVSFERTIQGSQLAAVQIERPLADCLMPAPPEEHYHPAGGERLAFALLGANSLSTLLLVWLALRQGDSYAGTAEQIAIAQLGQAAALPQGRPGAKPGLSRPGGGLPGLLCPAAVGGLLGSARRGAATGPAGGRLRRLAAV